MRGTTSRSWYPEQCPHTIGHIVYSMCVTVCVDYYVVMFPQWSSGVFRSTKKEGPGSCHTSLYLCTQDCSQSSRGVNTNSISHTLGSRSYSSTPSSTAQPPTVSIQGQSLFNTKNVFNSLDLFKQINNL